jgi:hypothetical protein
LTGSIRVLFWVFSITLAIFVIGSAIGPRVLRKMRTVNLRKVEDASHSAKAP